MKDPILAARVVAEVCAGDEAELNFEKARAFDALMSDLTPFRDGDVVYCPWTDGRLVGFKVIRGGDDRDVEYIYLNPSNRDGNLDDDPNVFVYTGTEGDITYDIPHVHFNLFDGS